MLGVAGRLGPIICKGAVYFTGFVNLSLGLGIFIFSFFFWSKYNFYIACICDQLLLKYILLKKNVLSLTIG